ncbi:hypothetical protein CEXT_415031 [Caerostris extrusa]|uniref:Uncharacterized protein n=1 Tax=Caerostris extrusa TaxID=172846 RepID=A0AAV4NVL5_CAEEX|nr:hypothetical protein CEXT_415031 [Caerostris extrusa]
MWARCLGGALFSERGCGLQKNEIGIEERTSHIVSTTGYLETKLKRESEIAEKKKVFHTSDQQVGESTHQIQWRRHQLQREVIPHIINRPSIEIRRRAQKTAVVVKAPLPLIHRLSTGCGGDDLW